MAQQYHNPFAGMDLIAPISQRNTYDRYCQTGGRASVDQSPFPRMIDLWFTGLSIAARRKLQPIDLSTFSKQETFKFHEGSILDSDSGRVQMVMLIAIAVVVCVEIVGEPRRMIAIANGLAAAGVPQVVEMLGDGEQAPIWNLSDALDEILRNGEEQPQSKPYS